MRNIKLSKQKKMMAKVRVRRKDQSTSKSYFTDIQTWALKRKKLDISKVASVTSDPQPTSIPTLEEPKPTSPKKMKTLMSKDVSQADLTITIVMKDSGSIHQAKPSSELKF